MSEADPLVVLSLFPGAGLLDLAFEQAGFTVLRGPDDLWGGDVRRFSATRLRGKVGGLIGGPPCPPYSKAKHLVGSTAPDLVDEFLRIYRELRPRWVVMENVREALRPLTGRVPADWSASPLRDWDEGGETQRTRVFWTWPFMILESATDRKRGRHSVMASTFKRGGGSYAKDKGFLPGNLPIEEYARLQGAEEILAGLQRHHANRAFAIHVLGNGVPLALGRKVAEAARLHATGVYTSEIGHDRRSS